MSVPSPRSGSGSRAPSPRRTLTAPTAEPESFYPRIPPRRSLSTVPPPPAAELDAAAHERLESGSQVDELDDEPADADVPPRSRSTLPLRVTRRRAPSNAGERPGAPRRVTSVEMAPRDDERTADAAAPPHSANSTASGMSTSRSAPNVDARGAPPSWAGGKADSVSPPLVPERKRAHRPPPLDARTLHEPEAMPLGRHLSQSPRYADWPSSAPGGPMADQRRLPPMLNEPSGSRPLHHLPSSSAAAREQAHLAQGYGQAGPRSLPASPRPLQRSPHEHAHAAPPAEDADLQPEEVDKFLALIEKHNLDASDEEDMARSVTELYQEWLEWCASRGTLSTKSKPALVSEFVRIHQGAYGPERRQRAMGIVQGSRHNGASNGREELGPALTAAAIHPGVGGPRRRQMPPTPFDGKPRYADELRSNGMPQSARGRMVASSRETNVTLSGDWRRTDRPHEQATMRRPAGPQSHPSYGPEPVRVEHMHGEPSPPGISSGKTLPPGLFDMMRADILNEARAMVLHELSEQNRELTAQNRALVARVEQLEKQSDNAAQWIQHLSRAQEDLSTSHAQASQQQQQAQQAQAQAHAAQQQHQHEQQQLHQQQQQQQRQEQQHREGPHPSPRYAAAAPPAAHPAYAHHPQQHAGPPRGAYAEEYESPPRRHPAPSAPMSGPSGSSGALPPPRYGNSAAGPDARRPRGEYEVEAGGPYADERPGVPGSSPHLAAQQQPRRMPPAPQYYPGAQSPAGEGPPPPHHAAQHPAAARPRMPEPREDPRRLAPFAAGSPSPHIAHDERMAKRPRNGYF